MKFDPIHKDLYTDGGKRIKRLHCPYGVKWEQLPPGNSGFRTCSVCKHQIVDSATLPDEELLCMTEADPDTCIKVDLNQPNIIVMAYEP